MGNRYESWNDASNILPVTSVSHLKAQTKPGKLLHFNKWSSVHLSKNGRGNWSYQVWLFSWRRRKRFMIQWLIPSRELTVHIISPTYPHHFCWWLDPFHVWWVIDSFLGGYSCCTWYCSPCSCWVNRRSDWNLPTNKSVHMSTLHMLYIVSIPK